MTPLLGEAFLISAMTAGSPAPTRCCNARQKPRGALCSCMRRFQTGQGVSGTALGHFLGLARQNLAQNGGGPCAAITSTLSAHQLREINELLQLFRGQTAGQGVFCHRHAIRQSGSDAADVNRRAGIERKHGGGLLRRLVIGAGQGSANQVGRRRRTVDGQSVQTLPLQRKNPPG